MYVCPSCDAQEGEQHGEECDWEDGFAAGLLVVNPRTKRLVLSAATPETEEAREKRLAAEHAQRQREALLVIHGESTVDQLTLLAEWLLATEMVPSGLVDSEKPRRSKARVMMAVKALDELGFGYATAIAQCMVMEGKFAIYGELPGACMAQKGIELESVEQWFEVMADEVRLMAEDPVSPSMGAALKAVLRAPTDEEGWVRIPAHRAPSLGEPRSEADSWPSTFRAVTSILRRGRSAPSVRSFSVAQAKGHDLWGKRGRNGNPSEWVRDPAQMLLVRSERRCQKAVAPEAFHGIATPEDFDGTAEPADAEFVEQPLSAARPSLEAAVEATP